MLFAVACCRLGQAGSPRPLTALVCHAPCTESKKADKADKVLPPFRRPPAERGVLHPVPRPAAYSCQSLATINLHPQVVQERLGHSRINIPSTSTCTFSPASSTKRRPSSIRYWLGLGSRRCRAGSPARGTSQELEDRAGSSSAPLPSQVSLDGLPASWIPALSDGEVSTRW